MVGILLVFVSVAHAMTPSFYISSSGGDSVTVNVTGDANSNIILYYNLNSLIQTRTLGITNSIGTFSTVISTSSYGITPGSSVYVLVNNQQSLASVWPTSSSSSLSLSQTNVNTSVGQYTTVTSYSSGSLYVSNNSNISVASTTVSNNTISIYGVSNGSSTLTVCQYGTSVCAYVYVTVGISSNYNSLSLSQTSLSLAVGQTSTVTASNNYNYGTLYVSSNSNQGVATAYASGNSISIYGVSNGSTTLIICQSGNTNSCGTVYVTVTGFISTNNGYSNSSSGFNISALSLSVGNSVTISSAASTGLYASGNTNPSVISVSYTSSSVPGCTATSNYSVITGQPCNNNGVYNGGYNGGYYSSVPGCTATSNYSILTGQSCFSGVNNGQYYPNYSNTNNNTSAIISALSPGSDTLTLCQNNSVNACTTIYITAR